MSELAITQKDLVSFKESVSNELKIKESNLIEEFKSRKAHLQLLADKKIEEYGVMNLICGINTVSKDNKPNLRDIKDMESILSIIDLQTARNSYSLSFWEKENQNFIQILCEIIFYFQRKMNMKEKLSQEQIVMLSCSIINNYPALRFYELLHVFHLMIMGKLVKVYSYLSTETIFEAIDAYLTMQSNDIEVCYSRDKKTESRGVDLALVEKRRIDSIRNTYAEKIAIQAQELERSKRKHVFITEKEIQSEIKKIKK